MWSALNPCSTVLTLKGYFEILLRFLLVGVLTNLCELLLTGDEEYGENGSAFKLFNGRSEESYW